MGGMQEQNPWVAGPRLTCRLVATLQVSHTVEAERAQQRRCDRGAVAAGRNAPSTFVAADGRWLDGAPPAGSGR